MVVVVRIFTLVLFWVGFVYRPTHGQILFNEIAVDPGGSTFTYGPNNLFTLCPPDGGRINVAKEWFELYNSSLCDTIDISCWTVYFNTGRSTGCGRDNYNNAFSFTFPRGTKMPPNSFFVCGGDSADAQVDFPFSKYHKTGYFCSRERLYLMNAGGWIALVRPDLTLSDAVYWLPVGTDLQQYFARVDSDHPFGKPYFTECGCPPGSITRQLPSGITWYYQGNMQFIGYSDNSGTILPSSFERRGDGNPNWDLITGKEPTPNKPNLSPNKPAKVSVIPDSLTLCRNGNARLTARIRDGIPSSANTFEWSTNPPTTTGNKSFFEFSPSVRTVVRLKLTQNGCVYTDSAVVDVFDVPVQPDFTLSKDTICTKEAVTVTYTGDLNTNYRIDWFFDSGTPSTRFLSDKPFQMRYNREGRSKIEVRLIDPAFGCVSKTVTKYVTVKNPNPANFTIDKPYTCLQDTVTLSFSRDNMPTEQFRWVLEHGRIVQDSGSKVKVLFNRAGSNRVGLSVFRQGAVCWSDTLYKTVRIYNMNPLNVRTARNICQNTETSFLYVGDLPRETLFFWDFGQNADNRYTTGRNRQAVRFNTVGQQTIILRAEVNDRCVSDPETLRVNVIPEPPNDFTFDPPVGVAPAAITFWPTNKAVGRYQWSFGNGEAPLLVEDTGKVAARFADPGIYTVTLVVTDNNGCASVVSKNVTIRGRKPLIQIPSVFSPNDDGLAFNPVLTILGLESVHEFELSIFARWGERVFKTNNPKVFWDGRHNGKMVPEGAYVYVLSGKYDALNDYEPFFMTGTITVLR